MFASRRVLIPSERHFRRPRLSAVPRGQRSVIRHGAPAPRRGLGERREPQVDHRAANAASRVCSDGVAVARHVEAGAERDDARVDGGDAVARLQPGRRGALERVAQRLDGQRPGAPAPARALARRRRLQQLRLLVRRLGLGLGRGQLALVELGARPELGQVRRPLRRPPRELARPGLGARRDDGELLGPRSEPGLERVRAALALPRRASMMWTVSAAARSRLSRPARASSSEPASSRTANGSVTSCV